jgi:hypothetical protein
MSLRKYIFVGAIVAFGFGSGAFPGWAQDKPSVAKKDRPETFINDPLQRALAVANKMQEEYSQEKLSIDEEAAGILRALKNPFMPQLPQPEVSPPKVVEPTVAVVHPITSVISPTAPPVVIKPSFKIAGFVWNTKHPQAIMNGIIVGTGDSLDGWEIKVINKDGIKVEKNGYQYWLKP